MSSAHLRLSILRLRLNHLVRGRPFPGICKKAEALLAIGKKEVCADTQIHRFFNSLLATEG